MDRKTIAAILGAVALFAAVVTVTLVATSGSGSDAPVHTLPGGQLHTGELPDNATTGDDMPGMEEPATAP